MIAREDDTKLRDYYAEHYLFHGPGGDLGFDGLRAYFASLRAAFGNLRIVREQIITDGRFLAARSTFWHLHQRVHLLARRTSRTTGQHVEWAVIHHVQIRRRPAAGRRVSAARLPQLLDQARRDRHGGRQVLPGRAPTLTEKPMSSLSPDPAIVLVHGAYADNLWPGDLTES